MPVEKFCVREGDTILGAMAVIQGCRNRCICALNQSQKLIGVVSQGDIIRALIGGANQYSLIDEIINVNFAYLPEADMEKAYRLMRSKNLTMIPVVDDDFYLKDVITLSDVFEYLEGKINRG